MSKKFTGLDAIIQPTDDKTNRDVTEDKKYINSNIPLLEEHHQKLRIIAIQENKTIRQLLREIISNYLDNK